MAPPYPPVAVPLDYQSCCAQRVKNREEERARDETSTADATDNPTTDATDNSTTDATPNATTGVQKHQAATTSATHLPRQGGHIFSGPPGPLPSVYGTILSGGRI